MKKVCLLFSSLSLLKTTNAVAWYNIWDLEFSDGSDREFYLYYQGITTGLKLTTHYTNFSKCSSEGIIELMDSVYQWYEVYTTSGSTWDDWVGEIFTIIADYFSNFYYYCSLAMNDVKEVNQEKFDEFQGINDIYTSFLFNLLQNSYQISDTAEDLQTAEDEGEWVDFVTNLAQLIDTILDFESSKAAANPT